MAEEPRPWRSGDLLIAKAEHSVAGIYANIQIGGFVTFQRDYGGSDQRFWGWPDGHDVDVVFSRSHFDLAPADAKSKAGPDYSKHAVHCSYNSGNNCNCHMSPPASTVYAVNSMTYINLQLRRLDNEKTEKINRPAIPD